MPVPKLCYTIWFTQRTGSTWLCERLQSTGLAGRPQEYLNFAAGEDALRHYEVSDADVLLRELYAVGMTPNGVFGIKQGYWEPYFGRVLDLIAGPARSGETSRLVRWQRAFPNHRHIFMTRRNKLRLAVSWWRAIQSGEWHRRTGNPPEPKDIADKYDAVAMHKLMQEAVAREAGLQELFTEAGVVPLAIAYEDAIQDPTGCLNGIFAYLQLPMQDAAPANTSLTKIADDLSEEWVQRFREDLQKDWPHRGW